MALDGPPMGLPPGVPPMPPTDNAPSINPMEALLRRRLGTSGQMMPPAPPPPVMLHDIKIKRKTKYGCARVEAVPPEEFGISRRAKIGSMQVVDYCYHETRKTEDELLRMGFDEESVASLPSSDFDDSEEALARDTVSDRSAGTAASNLNRPTRQTILTEHYLVMDYEGDGARLYRISTGGESGTTLQRGGKPAIDPMEENPFASITPFIMTHRFYGRSVADMVVDIQKIKTSLYRVLLDNAWLANNQRMEIAESHATKHTLDDLLTNRPGGIVRTKTPGGLNVVQNQQVGNFAYPLIEYVDQQREWRTGVSRGGQGLGSESLRNIGQEAILSMLNASQQKIRLIARIFAETGIRDLFLLLHAVTRRNATKAETVRLRRKWVAIDPNRWRRRDDMTVTVGLGSGSKPQQLVFLQSILDMQEKIFQQAPNSGLVSFQNVYNALKKLVETAGFRSVDPYFSNPEDQPDQGQQQQEQPPDPKLLEAQAKMKLDEQKMQQEMAVQAQRLKMDQMEAQTKAAERLKEIELRHQARLAEISADREMRIRQQDIEAQLRREQIMAESQTKVQTAVVDGAAKVDSASSRDGNLTDVRMGGEIG